MPVSNQEYWLEIESLPPFQEGASGYEKNWEWLEKLQSNARLTKLDLLRLKEILRLAYECGKNTADT